MEEGRTTTTMREEDAEPTPPGDDGDAPVVASVASSVKKKVVRVRSRGEHAAGRSMSGGEANGGEANVSGKPPTREERERAYRLARERIFGTAEDGDVGEGDGDATMVARDEDGIGRMGDLSPSSSTSSLNKTNKAVRRNKIADMFDPDFKRAGRAPLAPPEMMPQHPMMMPQHPGMMPQYPGMAPQYMVPPPQYMMPPPQYMVPPPMVPPPMGAQPPFVMTQPRDGPNEFPPLPNGAPNVNQPPPPLMYQNSAQYPQPRVNGTAPFVPPPPRPPSH